MRKSLDLSPALISALRSATRIVASTGAGISAESGLSTFRDKQTGLWAKYRPEDLATPQACRRDPRMVWDWYEWRRGFVAEARPNPGHHALARIEAQRPGFLLVTQNVDGLHQRAGSSGVLELHGNLNRFKCSKSGTLLEGPPPATDDPPPLHPETGHYLRPDVVWFGEGLPAETLQASIEAAHEADVYLTIGTSALVYPAAALPEMASRSGAVVIEINPTATPFSDVASFSLRGKAGELLPAIVEQVQVQ